VPCCKVWGKLCPDPIALATVATRSGVGPAGPGRGPGAASRCVVWVAVGGDGCFARCVTGAHQAAPTEAAKPEKTQNSVTQAIKYQWMWV
jgi:hypothetical protein